jgi:hypothetical protein
MVIGIIGVNCMYEVASMWTEEGYIYISTVVSNSFFPYSRFACAEAVGTKTNEQVELWSGVSPLGIIMRHTFCCSE